MIDDNKILSVKINIDSHNKNMNGHTRKLLIMMITKYQ